jgi:DNA-binding transcriptional LysR family regulator
MLPPTSLKYFAEAARSGSVRQAADALLVAPSVVSRHVAQLEREFGTALFERSPRGMMLTAAGRLLLDFVVQSEAQAQNVRAAIGGLGGSQRGRVRVALSEAAMGSFMPDLLAAFAKQFPHIVFQWSGGPTARIVDAVASQATDVGLAFNVPERGDIVHHSKVAQPLQLVCAPDHPLAGAPAVSMRDVAPFKVAAPDTGFGLRQLIDQLAASAGVDLQIAYEMNSIAAIKSMVRQADVVAFLPPMAFADELRTGWLRAVWVSERAAESATLDVITASGRELPSAVGAFLQHLLLSLRLPAV